MFANPPTIGDVYATVSAAVAWLDAASTASHGERVAARIIKLTEEAGEVAAAWIGMTGQNPRKGVTHTPADVADELADVVVTALVAIHTLGLDPAAVMARCATKVATRTTTLRDSRPAGGHPAGAGRTARDHGGAR